MNVGSLFSGIGGMDYGLAAAGHRHVFFCEWDGWRRDVLAARWPGVPVYDDVRVVGVEPAAGASVDGRSPGGDGAGRVHADSVPDLLCGGFPCQDLSVAGKRRGLAGERSGLFFEFARIIDAFRPRWLLVENVPGLLSSNGGRDFGVVLGTLADLGYGVGWRVLDSRFFGVPQRRRRVFIVGAQSVGDPRAAAERAGEVLAVGSRCDRHLAAGGEERAGTTFVSPLGTTRGGGHGLNADKAAGGQLIPQFVSENQRGEVLETPYAHQLTGGGGKPGQGYPAIREGVGVRRLTPRECERLQGLPDDWTLLKPKTPDSRRYSALGDAVTATVSEWIGMRMAELESVAA